MIDCKICCHLVILLLALITLYTGECQVHDIDTGFIQLYMYFLN